MRQQFVECCDGYRFKVDVLDGYSIKEGTINDGLMIEDCEGNQFIRIPSGYTSDGLYVKGFWVSRFDISIDEFGILHSIAGEYPSVNINYYDAMEVANQMNGSLISKEEYNRIGMWLVETDVVTFEDVFIRGNELYGNYSNLFSLAKTGSNPNWMFNRLDNFWGNSFIWTTEKSELCEHHRIIRGGNGISFFSKDAYWPMYRTWADPEKGNPNITFRVVIKDSSD